MGSGSSDIKIENYFDLETDKPEFRQELAKRIRECASIVGSGDLLAEKSGIPRRTLETYLAGTSEPKISAIVRIAAAAVVSVDWLAVGRGNKTGEVREPAGSYAVAGFNEQLLINVVTAVERVQQKEGLIILPEKKASLINLLYQLHRAQNETEVDMTNVIRLIDIAKKE